MKHDDLEIQWLRTFTTVVRMGSMTAASGKICRSQSAISMYIRKLEEALDVPLFSRETKL